MLPLASAIVPSVRTSPTLRGADESAARRNGVTPCGWRMLQNRKMKIVFVTNANANGGTEKSLIDLIWRLDPAKWMLSSYVME